MFPLEVSGGMSKIFDIFRWGNYLKVSKFYVHTAFDHILEKRGGHYKSEDTN